MGSGDPPWRTAGWVAAAVVLAGLSGYGGFILGGHRLDSQEERGAVVSRDRDESGDLAWFRELDLSRVVDAGANEQLRRTIKILGDRVHSLEEEVRFYRRLVAPMDDDAGFMIDRLDIARTRDPDRFVYTLVLTQAADRDGWIEGNLLIDVVGEQAGSPQSLSLAELSEESEYPMEFRFLYFEDLSGQMTLPAEFSPREIRVTAEVDAGRRFERVFAWTVE